jgi:hypothetical protein
MMKTNSLVGFAAFLVIAAMPLQASVVQNTNQVSQYGITWKFDKNYQVGQFANGDYWVVGPVTITSITPGWDGTRNGSMVNPVPNDNQAYDTRAPIHFNSNKLILPPVTLEPNSSLVSVISMQDCTEHGVEDCTELPGVPRPTLKAAAVLTVLGQVPPDNGATVFRPPYVGSEKPLHSTTNLRKDLLTNLPLISSTPDPTKLSAQESMAHLWLDHFHYVSDNVQFMSPYLNMPNYGREYSTAVGKVSLLLLSDANGLISRFGAGANKDMLLIRFVQIGIDLNYAAKNGAYWKEGGGVDHGRKWPILFAGLMLDDNYMKTIGERSPTMPFKGFHEDAQTFYVEETSPGVYNRGYGGFTAADVGLPDWGWAHTSEQNLDNKKWKNTEGGDGYRRCCTANSWAGPVLAMQIMGVKSLYNHNAIFDYMDRYMAIEHYNKGTGDEYIWQWDRFNGDMWDTYRANYGCVWTRSNPSDTYSNGSNGCDSNTPQPPGNRPPIADAGPDQTLTDSDNSGSEQVTLDGSHSSDPDGSIVSYVWTESGSQIAVNVKPTVSLPVGQHTITLQVTDNNGLTDTDTVVVTVEPPDTTPPLILSVTALESSVEIQFNESLDEPSASNPANYSLSDGLSISSVWFDSQHNRVILYTNSHQEGVTYTLTVANVKDTAGNAMPQTVRNYTYTVGLVGHWVFDTASGNSVVDISGHNNTGTLLNGTRRTSAGEASFDGVDDCVQIPTTSWHTNEGTVALWAYAADFSGVKYFFGHNVGSWTNTIQLYANGGNLCVGLGGNHTLATNIQNLSTNIWYHIALTWDGTNYVVYVDGTAKKSGTYPALTTLNSIADIGNTGNSSSRNEAFKGLIDEVRVYNKALTATEISDLSLVFLPIGDKTVAEGNELSFSIRTKPGVIVDLSDQNLPSLPSFTSNAFSWMPDYDDSGIYEVEFTAPHGTATDFERIAITVTDTQLPDINNIVPIGYWKFDETSGEIAYDSSPTGNTGYLKNGLDWSSGKNNGAIVFSVPNDAVEIQTTNFKTTAGTIAMWVYAEKLTLSRHYLFGHADESLANRIQLYLKYGKLCLGLGDSHETSMNIQRLQNQQWYHIALTWNSTTYYVYVDGLLKASGTYPGLTKLAGNADIGNNGINRDKALNGKIDDVRIYDRVLNAGEIARLAVGN